MTSDLDLNGGLYQQAIQHIWGLLKQAFSLANEYVIKSIAICGLITNPYLTSSDLAVKVRTCTSQYIP